MYYEQKIKKKGQKGGGKVELNDMDSISSLINNFTGGGGIESLGNIDKISGLLGSKGLGAGSSRFPLLLIIIIILLFSNKGCGGSMNNCPQYCCRSCSRKGRKTQKKILLSKLWLRRLWRLWRRWMRQLWWMWRQFNYNHSSTISP
jgi:hypothetical protein